MTKLNFTMAQPAPSTSLSILTKDLKINDVRILTGKMGIGLMHLMYREVLNTKFPQFLLTSTPKRKERKALYKSIIQEWHACPYYGRFVTRDLSSPVDQWTIAGYELIRMNMNSTFHKLLVKYRREAEALMAEAFYKAATSVATDASTPPPTVALVEAAPTSPLALPVAPPSVLVAAPAAAAAPVPTAAPMAAPAAAPAAAPPEPGCAYYTTLMLHSSGRDTTKQLVSTAIS
jgi:hypothetical protein